MKYRGMTIAWIGMAIPNSMSRNETAEKRDASPHDPVPSGQGEGDDHHDGTHRQLPAVTEIRPDPGAVEDGRVRGQGQPTGRQPGIGSEVLSRATGN